MAAVLVLIKVYGIRKRSKTEFSTKPEVWLPVCLSSMTSIPTDPR